MTNDPVLRGIPPIPDLLPEALDNLIARHGLRRVLLALIARPLRHRRVEVVDLSDHIRRDIGLPPSGHSPRHWDIRR